MRPVSPTGRAILFAALEPGAAAWMAPVWQRMPETSVVALAPVARAHLQRCGTRLPAVTRDLTDDIRTLLNEERTCEVLLSATGAPTESDIIAACRAADVHVTQIVDTWGGYERRFGHQAPHAIAVIDARAEAECRAAGAPAAAYVHLGHPAWEIAPALAPGDPRCVLVVGQPIAAIYGSQLGYDEESVMTSITRVANRRPDLVDRVRYLAHPAEDRPAVARVLREAAAALEQAGTVIGMFSSLLVDAMLGGRHVVVVQPGDGPDLFGPSRHGLLPRCRSEQDIERALETTSYGDGAVRLRHIVAGSTSRVLTHLEMAA